MTRNQSCTICKKKGHNKRRCDEIYDENDTCPICQEVLGETNISVTKCGHKFCMTCISTHVFIRNNCPLCRQPFDIVRMHPTISNTEMVNTVCHELYLFPLIQAIKDMLSIMNVDWNNLPNTQKALIRSIFQEYMVGFGTNIASAIYQRVETIFNDTEPTETDI